MGRHLNIKQTNKNHLKLKKKKKVEKKNTLQYYSYAIKRLCGRSFKNVRERK